MLELSLQNVAGEIKQELRSGVPNLKERLRIDVNPETRRGKVIYNGRIFNAKVKLVCGLHIFILGVISFGSSFQFF